MKRLFAALVAGSTLLTTLGTTAAEAPKPAVKHHQMTKAEVEAARQRLRDAAPADSYFGRMKLSYIGINNTFRDAMRMSGDSTTSSSIANHVEQADEALRDFSQRYPHDSALAQSYFLASIAEKKIWIQRDQERAVGYLKLLVSRYGDTYFGKLTKKDISGGITEHYYAAAVPCPTPEPTIAPTPSPEPTATPTLAPSTKRGRSTPTPLPTESPSPTPTPSPTPSPVPTPQLTAAPDGTKIVILPAACIAAPPTASPTPTATPSPVPTLSAPVISSPRPAASGATLPTSAPSPVATPTALQTPSNPTTSAPLPTPIASPAPLPSSTKPPTQR